MTRDLRLLLALLLPFVVLATLNSGGYRFGASDQAFYVPAVLERLDPALYPRDSGLIESQARLTFVDETLAPLAETGLPLTALCAALYIVTLVLLAATAWLIATTLFASRWTAVAFVAALTLRHAIAKTGTNTLEAYFHPRQLAFALGAVAIALFLRGRYAAALVPLLPAALLHPTTALWLLIWLVVAAGVAIPRTRLTIAVLAGAALLAGLWLVTAGPLGGRLAVMDAEWLATLTTKDYLFPLGWPVSVWLINLGYVPVIVGIWQYRRRAGLLRERENALVAGCLSLLAVFAAALVLHRAPVALFVQMQPARIFWMLDFLATAYAVWALVEGATPRLGRQVIATACITAFSIGRAVYVAAFLFPDRPMAAIDIPPTDWGRVMAWARATGRDTGWLADPVHAARYGTSVRVAGERDVFVEEIKDTAIGMYDREIAMRTRDRLAALGRFESLTAAQAADLGRRYDLDYLVTENALDLPVAFRSGPLRVYRLR
ncbi:MAG TPA: hypothetical protein VD833_13260 [Vicinamibacterales bacterium]|nr:hypothetical protein [Vicinamibacterales bacterium]